MKKKHLHLKQLKLAKETVLNLSAVKGGAVPDTGTGTIVVLTADCNKTMDFNCDTQGTVMPCCPGCRSGANNTVVKQYCTIIEQTMNCPFEPADPSPL